MKKFVILFIILSPFLIQAKNVYHPSKQSSLALTENNFEYEAQISFHDSFSIRIDGQHDLFAENKYHWVFERKSINTSTGFKNYSAPKVSSAYQFQKVERRTLTSLGLIAVGIPLLVLGISNDETAILTVGATSIVAGFTIAIAGHYQVIGPGYVLKKNEITLSSAEHGIGFALNF